MKKIVITGSGGVVGSVLRAALSTYDITRADRNDVDLREYEKLKNVFEGKDVVIHLAWNMSAPEGSKAFSENETMFTNVYRAALASRVKRVIMASSVHADDFYNFRSKEMMSVHRVPKPVSRYGVQKVYMEALGSSYAANGLEVICIRLGDVNTENRPATHHPLEAAVFLSHNDLSNLIKISIEAEVVPDNFVVMYGVSDNEGRILDVSNPFGWKPGDRAEDFSIPTK